MRDPNRIKPFLDKLYELWILHSDLRFNQLVRFIESNDEIAFNKEEPETLKVIEKLIDEKRSES